LNKSTQAAFRPVHIQNIGLSADHALDPYWNKVYQEIGLGDTGYRVESYVDMQWIWPYFNTHLFAIDPRQAVLRTWLNHFTALIADVSYQEATCSDVQHRIFLHQAVLSTLLVKSIEQEQIRILPPEYSYPLHLHKEISPERRVTSLNDLVCPVYEGAFQYPDTVSDMEIEEPVLSWFHENKPDIAS
jgi:hypothetical protein